MGHQGEFALVPGFICMEALRNSRSLDFCLPLYQDKGKIKK